MSGVCSCACISVRFVHEVTSTARVTVRAIKPDVGGRRDRLRSTDAEYVGRPSGGRTVARGRRLARGARPDRAGFLASIGYVGWCALTGRRGPLLRPAIVALVSEGVLVVANRGDCPLGLLGERIGDPVPLFELVLSPRAARRAVPTLAALGFAYVMNNMDFHMFDDPREKALRDAVHRSIRQLSG